MDTRKLSVGVMAVILVAMSGLGVGWWARPPQVEGALAAPATLAQSSQANQAIAAVNDPLVLSYAAKFSCLEPLQPG